MPKLSLAARYRNAKLAHVPYERMSPSLQCMHWVACYREARDRLHDTRGFGEHSHIADQASDDMEFAAHMFAFARAKLRSAIRFNNAVEAAA